MIRNLIKTHKSAGVRVTRAVHRLISRGNVARDAGRWTDAASAYRAALAADPHLHHIFIQLGHVLAASGRPEESEAAYAEAARLRPHDAEAAIHESALARHRRGTSAAMFLLLAAWQRGDSSGEAEREIRRVLEIDDAFPPAELRSLLAEVDLSEFGTRAAKTIDMLRPSDRRPTVFDITDLVGHFRYQRLPTGIQRVQLEIVERAVGARDAGEPLLVTFISGRGGLLAIPLQLFLDLAAQARSGGDIADPHWQRVRANLFLHLSLADRMVLPLRAILINLGTSLWVADYFRFIRNARDERDVSYIPFVHDLIPIKVPDYCVPDIRREFAGWLAGVFPHADGFLANSRSTAHDLLGAARYLGHDLPEDRVRVVPLDANFGSADPLPIDILGRWGLRDTNYALMVATIEPRKNHVLAFDAWAELIRRYGDGAVPKLVCVGRDGWLNDRVFARLAADPALIAAVTIIHRASDAEMALLYQCSDFTIVPSHYEGWGLPITESLCQGRVPVIADNSSLPEAGAGLSILFESGSISALVGAVERAAFDLDERRKMEARITTAFAPRSWEQIAGQVLDEASDLASGSSPGPIVQPILRGAYYPVGLHGEMEIWPGLVNGEIFRVGHGWLWPETGGCRTAPAGGALRLRLAGRRRSQESRIGGSRFHVRVRGLAEAPCPVIVRAEESEARTTLAPGGTAWLTCDLSTDQDMVSVTVRGLETERVTISIGGERRSQLASVAVVGLLWSDGDDQADRLAMAAIEKWRGNG